MVCNCRYKGIHSWCCVICVTPLWSRTVILRCGHQELYGMYSLNSPNMTILQLSNLWPLMWRCNFLRTMLLDSMKQRWVWHRIYLVWHAEDHFLSSVVNGKWWFKTSEYITDVCDINALCNGWDTFNCKIGQDPHIAYCSCKKWLLRSNQVDCFVLSQFCIFSSQKFPVIPRDSWKSLEFFRIIS